MSRASFVTALFAGVVSASAFGAGISGVVQDAAGNPMGGVSVSAIDEAMEMSVTVFSQPDGSYSIDGLADQEYVVRARLIGKEDAFEDAKAGEKVSFKLDPAEDLDMQRTGDNLFSLVKWDNEKDKQNFKMFCGYCHQVGTLGFRSPEEPVDWETMVTRMDGFGGLYKHTQETLVTRLLEAYSEEGQEKWPAYEVPAAPSGKATKAVITEWDLGRQDATMTHDLELGTDGKVYVVDMINDAMLTLDPKTGERETIGWPDGKDPATDGIPRKGPHSLERDADGNMWVTLALSGQMSKYDVKTGEFTTVSSAPAPRPRGAYPHTLRIDDAGTVWYTDAGAGVFSLDPKTNEVTQYKLPTADQVSGGGRGESRGVTPYGIAASPKDGTIWYTKLNGNRLGRIDPSVDGGDVKEWNPPFTGPRRAHVAKDGIVWVPGFGSGVVGAFNPETEEWKVYELPDAINQIPYALNIHPQTGEIWICGTGNDTMTVLDPKTGEFTEIRMPSRVTYTREVEFAEDGSVWVCNSNYPVRHTERGKGSVIKIEMTD